MQSSHYQELNPLMPPLTCQMSSETGRTFEAKITGARARAFQLQQGSYCSNMNKEALDYAESEATKNIEFHLKNIESLSKEAHLTLAVLMVSIPAAFTVAIKLYQKDGMWTWATALLLLSTYLWFLAVYVGKAMKPRGVHAPGHEPNNLLPALREEKHTLEQIRESALINMQERIDWNRKRSEETGGIINQTRRAIIASPFVFLAFVLLILFVRWTLTFGC